MNMSIYNHTIYCSAVSCTKMKCALNQNTIETKHFEEVGLPLATADFWTKCDWEDKWNDFEEEVQNG